jgi:hypothetical protein
VVTAAAIVGSVCGLLKFLGIQNFVSNTDRQGNRSRRIDISTRNTGAICRKCYSTVTQC